MYLNFAVDGGCICGNASITAAVLRDVIRSTPVVL
jgi:hypothetical protein